MRLACLALAAVLSLYGLTAAADTPAPAPDPLMGTWSGQAHDGAESRPFGLRFVAGKNAVPDLLWTLPEANISDFGPMPMVLQDGWYNEAARYEYDIKLKLSDDQQHITGVLDFDGNTLPFEVVKGELPVAEPRDMGGQPAQALWSFKTGGPIWSTPAFVDGAVYFGSTDGKVYALDAASGKQKWSTATGGAVWSPITLDGAYLYSLSDDGFLYKLTRADGKRVWRFDTHGGKVKREGYDRLASGATLAGGTLYVGSADGGLYALDPKTGRERWHYLTQGMVRSTPAVADGRVYFGSYDHAVYALDAHSGTLVWRRDTYMPVVSAPLALAAMVYVGSRNANFYALDAATGHMKWRSFDWVSWVESAASARDGVVYVGCSDCRFVFAYDGVSGKEQWRFNTGGESWPTPLADDQHIYAGSVGYAAYGRFGGFYVLDRATGKPVWRFDMPPMGGDDGYGVGGSPALGGDRVYFGGLDGVFYAFASGS